MRAHRRPGHSVPELLVALALGAMVLGAAVAATVRGWRAHRANEARAHAEAALDGAARALAAAVLATPALDVAVVAETAVVLRPVRAIGVVCEATAGVLWIAPAAMPARAPQTTDRVEWLSEPGAWRSTQVTRVRTARLRPDCRAQLGALLPSATVNWELTVGADSAGQWPPLRALIRVRTHERWALYRGGDGWQLGQRECGWAVGSACAVPQPVVGALASAREGGFQVRRHPSGWQLDGTLRSGDGVTRRWSASTGGP